jgi:L-threonylcarbamoyladenylate synthase
MEIISNPTLVEIKKAAKALKDGHLVAFPTETVYGLGADATNEKAVSKVYSVKGRPTDHPLIVHIGSVEQLFDWVSKVPDYAYVLAREFWPGPLTLILPRNLHVGKFLTGGQDSVGIRIPNNAIALDLLKEFRRLGKGGIAAPSANKFGLVSPTTSIDVYSDLASRLGKDDLLIDGGVSKFGIESTIVSCLESHPKILRPGFITPEKIKEKTNIDISYAKIENDFRVSGSLNSHYSPAVEVAINTVVFKGDAFLALSSVPTPVGAMRIASPKTIQEFAKHLYKYFRMCDELGMKRLVVVTPKGPGLAVAINDRIHKAGGVAYNFEID